MTYVIALSCATDHTLIAAFPPRGAAVVDADRPRNTATLTSHGFLTHG